MCVRGIYFAYCLPFMGWILELFRQCDTLYLFAFHLIIGGENNPAMMMFHFLLLTAELKLQSLNKDGCSPSSVIKIIKMKYNRIDIK